MLRKKTVTALQPNAEVDQKNPVKVYEYNRILKEFENDKEFIQSLSTSGIDIDLYLLSSILYQIQRYQEINFGRYGVKSNHSLFTKLPIQLFQDFSPNGSLSIILKEALRYQQQQNMKSFDILSSLSSGPPKELNESLSDEFLHVLRKIQTSLIEMKYLKRPVISFSKNISAKDRKIYKSIVLSHGGTVVENIDTAAAGLSSSSVTHMVEWNEEIDSLVIPSPSNLTAVLASLNSSSISATDLSQQQQVPTEEEFIRPLAIDWEDNSALVHWYYYPDSYDEKIPREEIEVDVTETFTNMAKTLNMTGSSGSSAGISTVGVAGSDSNSAAPMNIDDDAVTSGNTANIPSVTTKPTMLTVCCRYLIDLERFNEWGNEEDYIVEINTADSVFDSTAASVDGGSKTGLTLTLKRKSKRKSTGLSKVQLSQKGSQQQLASSALASASTDQLLTKEQFSTTGYDASVNLFLDVTVPSKRMDATKVTVSDLTNDADIKVYQESENTGSTNTGATTGTGEVTDDDKKAAAGVVAGGVSMDTTTADNVKHYDNATDKSKTESKQGDGDGDEQQPQDKKQKTSHNDNYDEDDIDNCHLPSWFLKNAVSTFEREHLPWLNNSDTTTAAAVDIEYLQIRNRIMTLASQQQQQQSSSAVPAGYLSATQCRRMIAFNVNTILAVHSFLDAYGIINQNVSARLKPTYMGFSADSVSSSISITTTAVYLTDEEKKSVGRSLDEYLSLRLDALHKKTKLFVDIEQSIDSRLNSVAVERRDVQIQRAQLAMVAAAVSGSSGSGQDMMMSSGGGGGGNVSSSSALSSR